MQDHCGFSRAFGQRILHALVSDFEVPAPRHRGCRTKRRDIMRGARQSRPSAGVHVSALDVHKTSMSSVRLTYPVAVGRGPTAPSVNLSNPKQLRQGHVRFQATTMFRDAGVSGAMPQASVSYLGTTS